MDLAGNYYRVKETIPPHVKLVAVSKFKPLEMIRELREKTGHQIFGENRAREFSAKASAFSEGVEWHFIGHLQTNKVKLVVPFASLVHSVDSPRLLAELDKEAAKAGNVVPVLLQFYIAREETKFGFDFREAGQMLESEQFRNFKHIRVSGVMGMASFVEDPVQVRREFSSLRNIFEKLKADYFAGDDAFREISMGMSGDYRIAIDEGSTMVRIGSLIFGER